MSEELVQLTPELKAFIAEWKSKPGNLIMVLHKIQQAYGYIPRDIAIEISELLEIPLAKIYGVITFYNFFKLQKAGKHLIQVCLGTACYLRGGDDLLKAFEQELGVGVNTTTPDGLFSVEAVRCLGCCGLAPVAVVDGEVHGKISAKDVPAIIRKYRTQG
ncbi:MAG: NAD(P)H-dependent oxidoreductase subunit E [Kiritimatiellia bacterium]|jgi:NADH-quinone oxidoreductase subunit E